VAHTKGGQVDEAALERLGAERIDWRFKGFPATFHGMTAAELAAARRPLTEFSTPLLVLDGAALDHNVALMAGYCAEHGVGLAPHGKTTMAPQLFARQLKAGSWGVTAATIAHVRAYRVFGVETIMLANEFIDPDALAWVAAELRRDPAFRLLCFADSVAGIGAMQAALSAADAPRPVDIVIDLGLDGGRAGCRDIPGAERVARAVHGADRLRLVGVGGFEGALARERTAAALERIRGYLHFVRQTAAALDRAGLFEQADEILLTAGGSAYFDDVVAILAGAGAGTADAEPADEWTASRPVRTILRSGAYITHDDGHYRRLTPFGNPPASPERAFRPALRIIGRVLSRPEPGLALLDFGKRDAPLDLGLPEPHEVRRADGTVAELTGCSITALADQHAFLALAPDTEVAVGDVVSCGVSHPCTTFDKWRLIPVVEDGRVVELIHTFF
jgi:D-serine deaminase-like pyridoxal phosphate-dependent protein